MLLNILNNGLEEACVRDGFIRRSLTAYKGCLTYEGTSWIPHLLPPPPGLRTILRFEATPSWNRLFQDGVFSKHSHHFVLQIAIHLVIIEAERWYELWQQKPQL